MLFSFYSSNSYVYDMSYFCETVTSVGIAVISTRNINKLGAVFFLHAWKY